MRVLKSSLEANDDSDAGLERVQGTEELAFKWRRIWMVWKISASRKASWWLLRRVVDMGVLLDGDVCRSLSRK